MIIPDAPIKSIEDDRLGRASFASRLAEIIYNWDGNESVVIGLYGPWGSGKTSVMNMLIEEIYTTGQNGPENKYPTVVQFNPWNFSDQNQLIGMFFAQLMSSIDSEGSKNWRELRETISKYGMLLSPSSDIPLIGPYVKPVTAFMKALKPTENIYTFRKEIDDAFEKLEKRVIITLDDLDRLSQPELRLIFQLIKLNADFPNTIYIIAADRPIVEKSLDTEQGIAGRDYLKKIVQVGYDIPHIDPMYIGQILSREIEVLLADVSLDYWNEVRWGNLYFAGFRSFFETIRDIKRFINALGISLRIISSEVNIIDLIGIETLRVFLPEIHDSIASNKPLFTSISKARTNETEALKNQLEEIFDLAGSRKKAAKNICLQLFPNLEQVYRNTSFDKGWQTIWRNERRVCAEDVFDIYFLMGTPSGEISKGRA